MHRLIESGNGPVTKCLIAAADKDARKAQREDPANKQLLDECVDNGLQWVAGAKAWKIGCSINPCKSDHYLKLFHQAFPFTGKNTTNIGICRQAIRYALIPGHVYQSHPPVFWDVVYV